MCWKAGCYQNFDKVCNKILLIFRLNKDTIVQGKQSMYIVQLHITFIHKVLLFKDRM